MNFFMATLSCLLVLCSGEPEPQQQQQPNWPWLTKPGQGVTPSYWHTGGWASGSSGGDNRGPGWGSSDNGWGTTDNDHGWGTLNTQDTVWGTRMCGGVIRRPRCAPSINEIEQKFMLAGKKMDGFCAAYTDRPLREVYGVERFKLRVRLNEFTSDDIQVRVRERLVMVLARSCSSEFAAIRLLPDVVDSRRGSWRMESHTLTVMFPYTVTPDAAEMQSRCGREFLPDPIIVPKVSDDFVLTADYDISFSNANFRRAIRRYLNDAMADDDDQYVD